jgi:hypothetical protein
MSCCGRNRVSAGRLGGSVQQNSPLLPRMPVNDTRVFEYVGTSTMTVVGPVTRTRYYFPTTGVRVPVDTRDAGYMSAVPNLRHVRD